MKLALVLSFALLAAINLHAQQTDQSQDSADVSAAEAAIEQIQQPTSEAESSTQSAGMTDRGSSCSTAVEYVESPNGLLGEWDLAVEKYTINQNEVADLKKYKQELLSDSWWATSSGPDIAREIRTTCKLLTDVFGALNPTGDPLDLAKGFGAEASKRTSTVFQVVSTGGDIIDAVKEGTIGLAMFAIREQARRVGAGRLASILSSLQDVEENVKSRQEGAEYKAKVREQLDNLDDLMNQYQNRAEVQQDRLQAIEAMKDAVISACNSKPDDRANANLPHAPSDNPATEWASPASTLTAPLFNPVMPPITTNRQATTALGSTNTPAQGQSKAKTKPPQSPCNIPGCTTH